MTKKNLIKSLAFLPVVTGTIAMTPAPASAFWNLFGPSHQQVCESLLPDVEKSIPKNMKEWGLQALPNLKGSGSLRLAEMAFWFFSKPDDFQYSGNVTAVKTHRDIRSIGYKPVTGCVTKFTFDNKTYVLKFNVESGQSDQYYYSMIAPHSLN